MPVCDRRVEQNAVYGTVCRGRHAIMASATSRYAVWYTVGICSNMCDTLHMSISDTVQDQSGDRSHCFSGYPLFIINQLVSVKNRDDVTCVLLTVYQTQ